MGLKLRRENSEGNHPPSPKKITWQAELKDGIFKEHWKSVFDVWEKSQISFTRSHYKKRLLYCRQKHLFRG